MNGCIINTYIHTMTQISIGRRLCSAPGAQTWETICKSLHIVLNLYFDSYFQRQKFSISMLRSRVQYFSIHTYMYSYYYHESAAR